jgi:glutamate-1-semialdehyde 2,1-aminomutase
VTFKRDQSNALQSRAFSTLPLGVNSNFRYWGDGITPYLKKSKGAYVWDVDDNCYIDYRLAFGPIIIGHADETVNAKVHEEIDQGILCAMTSELEVQVCEHIVAMCPAVEMVRLACSGTEATMHAVRLARAFTGREKILKFEGMYHGFQDYTLFSTYAPAETYGNRYSPVPIPATSGIPKSIHELVVTLPFNDFEALDKTLRRVGFEIAAIISEPCMGNCGAIEPAEGFLDFIRKKCDEYGIVFILDEVKTGFRLARGGAQEYFNIAPDIATYAKSLGNGFPIAAFGGKREIMSIIGQGVAQGGTYTNNKCGIAAAYATLEMMQKLPIHDAINRRGARLMEGLSKIFEDASILACLNGYPAMFSFAIGRDQVRDQREWGETEHSYYLRLVEAAMQKGIMPREPWFLCYAHSDEMIDETLNVMRDVVKSVSR